MIGEGSRCTYVLEDGVGPNRRTAATVDLAGPAVSGEHALGADQQARELDIIRRGHGA